MILFQCSCGNGCRASEEQSGQEFQCPNCQSRWLVPTESQPGLVLIYGAGSPIEGTVMTLEELGEGIATGRYGKLDLIWSEGGWKPLAKVYELPVLEENVSTEDSGKAEIALRLRQLPAAKVSILSKEPRGMYRLTRGIVDYFRYLFAISFWPLWGRIVLYLILFAGIAAIWLYFGLHLKSTLNG